MVSGLRIDVESRIAPCGPGGGAVKTKHLVPIIALIVAACATGDRSLNTFFVNGQQVTYSEEQMAQFRSMWSDPVPFARFKTGMTASEARWAADFIAVQERNRNTEKRCTYFEMQSIGPSPGKVLDLLGRYHPAGSLRPDELWRLNACGTNRAYRVFQPANSLSLVVFEARL